MKTWTARFSRPRLLTAAMSLLVSAPVVAQLQITEILYNSVQEPKWEWVEVRNTGGTPLDLSGYYFDDDDGNALAGPNILSTAMGGSAQNTVVPAGGVAVLYNGGNLAYDDARFREPWNLTSGTPLIAVDGPPGLANSGDAIGIWTAAGYAADIGDNGMGNNVVLGFGNSAATIDYGMGFPSGTDASIYWKGIGAYTDPAQWLTSMDGTDGATTSVQTFTAMTQVNDTNDFGSPGLIPAGSAAAGLLITEIMYNPASPETSGDWEWVEVFNNTGSNIDFGATPHILDDDDSGPLSAENIMSGDIPNGGVAILYNADDISLQNIQDAWGGSNNYIPVTDWSGLSNSGDSLGIWDDFGTYATDEFNGSFAGAITTVTYDDGPPFPIDNGEASIHLHPLTANPADGANWSLTGDTAGLNGTADTTNLGFGALAAIDSQEDHPGNDVGSPGVFEASSGNGDFDNDGDYDCDDVDALVVDIAGGSNTPAFDLTGDGSVNGADLDAWLSEAGEINLGPGKAYLDGDANLDGVVDVGDFNIWNGNKFTNIAAWCAGDFNADGSVDVSDFSSWNGNKFTASDQSVVPEPNAILLLLAGLPLMLLTRRK